MQAGRMKRFHEFIRTEAVQSSGSIEWQAYDTRNQQWISLYDTIYPDQRIREYPVVFSLAGPVRRSGTSGLAIAYEGFANDWRKCTLFFSSARAVHWLEFCTCMADQCPAKIFACRAVGLLFSDSYWKRHDGFC